MALSDIYREAINLAGDTMVQDAFIAAQERHREEQSRKLDRQLKTLQIAARAQELQEFIANKPIREKERTKTLQELTTSMDVQQNEFIAQKLGTATNQEEYDRAKGEVQQAFPDLPLKMFGFGDDFNEKTQQAIETHWKTAILDMPTSRKLYLQAQKDIAAANRAGKDKGTWSLKNAYDPKTDEWFTGRFHSGTGQLQTQQDNGSWKDVSEGGLLYASFQDALPGVPSTSNLKQVMPAVKEHEVLGNLDVKEQAQVAPYVASRQDELLRRRQAANIIEAREIALKEAADMYTTNEPNWLGLLYKSIGGTVPEMLTSTKYVGGKPQMDLPEGLTQERLDAAMKQYGVSREEVIRRYNLSNK